MFSRRLKSFPTDPAFPKTLAELGYFVNDKSQIRSIKKPDQAFIYKITDNDRHNEVRREALNACIRSEIEQRMIALAVPPLYLPRLTTKKPKGQPHVPIYATPQEVLKSKKRILIVVNDNNQDLGVWSHRHMNSDGGINGGSCVGLMKGIESTFYKEEEPGVLILNLGQLLYSHLEDRAMTITSWLNRPKPSPLHPEPRIHPIHNSAEGNRTPADHVAFVFDNIVRNPDWIASDADIYLIGVQEGGNLALNYLNENWSSLGPRIAAIALTNPAHRRDDLVVPFANFLADRARAFQASSAPLHTVLDTPSYSPPPPVIDEDDIETAKPTPLRVAPMCPVISSAEPYYAEQILPEVAMVILEWFREVAKNVEDYKNPVFEVTSWEENIERELEEEEGWSNESEAKANGQKQEEEISKEEVIQEKEEPNIEPKNETVTVAGVKVEKSWLEGA